MPIPTRLVPGRDPRKQPASVGRSLTNPKPSSATTQQTEQITPRTVPSALPSRRQSLVKPSQLKTPSSAKSGGIPTSTRTVGRGPTSPVKQNDRQQNGRPPSPKKMEMPPPPRPIRSSSLRQPPNSNTATPTVARGHTRHRSQVVTPNTPKTPQTPSVAGASRSRNQFNTYQQHYTPKKTPKPPTPTPSVTATPDRPPLIPSSWPEIAALQTELLQLSLFHKSSLQHSNRWENDAEKQLQNKYISVARDYRAILDVEKESQRKINGQALHDWLQNSREHNGQQGFAQQVQLLSQIAQEVYDIGDSRGGRYTIAVREFENWLQKVEEIKAARSSYGEGQDSALFIDPIDHRWKEDTTALIMKLELASRQLQSLDILGFGEVEALDGSALFRTAKGLGDLMGLMVEELSAIRRIEASIVKSETTGVSQLAQQLIAMQPRENPPKAILRTGNWRRSSPKS
ncbi:uncharacterized protein BJX67DRAFT_233796 [Aspergillus lucknowensis]|uniref:Uncharacterized protein n=1 Tax=Aspergillus lucknowensis TaxID=176173 RepID=A0ABR4LKN7_9EURO